MHFEKAGKHNTEKTLELAVQKCEERGISHLVVASTAGDTALASIKAISGKDIKLVVVTHNVGFRGAGVDQFSSDVRITVEEAGGIVYTGTMVLRGLGKSVKTLEGGSEENIVANSLRMMCQGIKVVAEIAAMVADAGIIPNEDIVVVAGTGRGADTAVVIAPQSSNNFFDMKIRELICKPYDF